MLASHALPPRGDSALSRTHEELPRRRDRLEYSEEVTPPGSAGWGTRVVAAILAAVWILAGTVCALFAIRDRRWLLLALAILAIWYGLVWLRVVREGRRLRWPEGLLPWRRS